MFKIEFTSVPLSLKPRDNCQNLKLEKKTIEAYCGKVKFFKGSRTQGTDEEMKLMEIEEYEILYW